MVRVASVKSIAVKFFLPFLFVFPPLLLVSSLPPFLLFIFSQRNTQTKWSHLQWIQP